jgi:hypothetical protein
MVETYFSSSGAGLQTASGTGGRTGAHSSYWLGYSRVDALSLFEALDGLAVVNTSHPLRSPLYAQWCSELFSPYAWATSQNPDCGCRQLLCSHPA